MSFPSTTRAAAESKPCEMRYSLGPKPGHRSCLNGADASKPSNNCEVHRLVPNDGAAMVKRLHKGADTSWRFFSQRMSLPVNA